MYKVLLVLGVLFIQICVSLGLLALAVAVVCMVLRAFGVL